MVKRISGENQLASAVGFEAFTKKIIFYVTNKFFRKKFLVLIFENRQNSLGAKKQLHPYQWF